MKTSLGQDLKGHGQEGAWGIDEEDALGTVPCTLATWLMAMCLPSAPLNLTLFGDTKLRFCLYFKDASARWDFSNYKNK